MVTRHRLLVVLDGALRNLRVALCDTPASGLVVQPWAGRLLDAAQRVGMPAAEIDDLEATLKRVLETRHISLDDDRRIKRAFLPYADRFEE